MSEPAQLKWDGTEKVPMLDPYTVKTVMSALSETADYNHELIGVSEMWRKSRGKGVRVAVLDTGCPQHLDLDVKGCKDFSQSPTPFDAVAGHSTHVCGIIAALENGVGVRGIAPEVDLYCGKVLADDGTGSMHAIAEGIRWAVDEVKVDVINLSLGCPALAASLSAIRKACQYAHDRGVVICAAAGNDAGSVNAPACFDTTIAVSAVDRGKNSASFTCHGDEVDFAAGGVDVFSTWLNNQYAKLSGTSMATPVISGVAALVIGAARNQGKRLTPDEVYAEIEKFAVDIGGAGKDEYTGHGIPVFSNCAAETPQRRQPPWWVSAIDWLAGLFRWLSR